MILVTGTELMPAGAPGAFGCRIDPDLAEDLPYGGGGDLDADGEQFAVDAPVPQPGFSRAWTAGNCRHADGVRRGAGPGPAAARIRQIIPSPTRYPRPSSSPWVRRYPQRGFCRASCTTSRRTSSGTGDRPGASG
jgi:hypothetical protein